MFVYKKTNEAFVADGYGNRRVIVLDADTGTFKRMWGVFGNAPDNAPPSVAAGGPAAPPQLDTEGAGSQAFSNPVHAIKISNDGLVYVADRSNRRVQVFTPDGKYMTQVFINRAGPSNSSAAGLGFSPDAQQQFLYVADLGNSSVGSSLHSDVGQPFLLSSKDLLTLNETLRLLAGPSSSNSQSGYHHAAAGMKSRPAGDRPVCEANT